MSAKAAKSSDVLSAVDFLAQAGETPVPGVVAVFGDETFLKRLALQELRRRVTGGDDAEFSVRELAGDSAAARDVFDELRSPALFGGGRSVVIVEEADKFVSTYRGELEDYAAKPSSHGVLILEVDTWPSNTRLYKAVAASGLNIECDAPADAALAKWLSGWTKSQYRAKLEHDAAEQLVEMVGPQLGLLDQELAKLASAAGSQPITTELVDRYVGTWRTKTAWEMIDAIADGNAPAAIKQLDRLLSAGEHPIGLLAQIASTFRRFAAATRLLSQHEQAGRRVVGRQILQEAGFKPFVLEKAERQWKQLGRKRSGGLYAMLLEMDVALKGRASQAARGRLVLEEFIVRLSQTADPRKTAAAGSAS